MTSATYDVDLFEELEPEAAAVLVEHAQESDRWHFRRLLQHFARGADRNGLCPCGQPDLRNRIKAARPHMIMPEMPIEELKFKKCCGRPLEPRGLTP